MSHILEGENISLFETSTRLVWVTDLKRELPTKNSCTIFHNTWSNYLPTYMIEFTSKTIRITRTISTKLEAFIFTSSESGKALSSSISFSLIVFRMRFKRVRSNASLSFWNCVWKNYNDFLVIYHSSYNQQPWEF